MPVINHDDASKNLYITEFNRCVMVPIVRQDKDAQNPAEGELFSTTVIRSQSLAGFEVCINACWYDLTFAGKVDAASGDDPVNASETLNQGIALTADNQRYGTSSPQMFYAAQDKNLSWKFGMGDVPNDMRTGVGGLCPLIINGLKYGTGNKYSRTGLKGATLTGAPLPEHARYLIQRNNNKYAALETAANNDPGIGKVGFGVTADGKCYVVVQAHRRPGMSFNDFRNIFVNYGCVNAVAGDGSDSVFFYRDGQFHVRSNHNKEETMTIGIGFKLR